MRDIKFRYIFDAREEDCGIQIREYTIEQIEENEPYNFMDCCFTTSAKITRVEYTGLKDKNGKEIYEGDIVRVLYTDWISKSSTDTRSIEQYKKDISDIKVVIWSVQGFYVSNKIDGYAETMKVGKYGEIEIIGNIYENENTELIK